MKTAIITGAGGNLGKASVEKFAKDGYNIVATVSPGKTLGYQIKGNVETVQIDLLRENEVEEMVGNVIAKYQNIDAALLLVGGFAMGGIDATKKDELAKMFSLNFYTAYNVVRPLFNQMMKQTNGGRIVMIGSKPALEASEGKNKIAYGLSKSLLVKLAEYLNIAGSSSNVTVSIVAPSIIDTPENRKSMPKANFEDWIKAEEIAEAMAMVCGETGRQLRQAVLKVYGKS